jgi:uncharacterized LabA/DUF88 family protein
LLKDKHKIVGIKYFTAEIKATDGRTNSPQKQQTYIRAIKEFIPNLEVKYGYFSSHTIRMPSANPPPNTVEVIKTEEKGSDVNLAVQLINDAWLNRYDSAIIVSNDSDMAESMRMVRKHHPEKVLGLITPGKNTRTSEQLKVHSHFVRKLHSSILKKSQLPDTIPGTNLKKPSDW